MTESLWLDPHHDGSELCVPDPNPTLGGTVSLFLRAPRGGDLDSAWVRVINDGEPELVEATVDREDERATWLRADFPVVNPVVSYRWLLGGGPVGYRWLNGAGLFHHDVADAADFRLSTYEPPPTWATGTMYQIFPDRFAKSVDRPAPAWAKPAGWDDPVVGEGPDTPNQFYGGDLDCITAHLDHIASLGVGTIYLTPFFPAESNHRYNASTFSRVDPLLGGNEAMERLAAAAHARGMRLMGDLTTNHCGNTHEWLIYQGDELGLEAWGPEYARAPMPWDHQDRWDARRLAFCRELFGLRAGSSALQRGGLRWLSVEDDAVTFVRESPAEAVPVRLPTEVVGAHLTALFGAEDLHADADGAVTPPGDGPSFAMWLLAN